MCARRRVACRQLRFLFVRLFRSTRLPAREVRYNTITHIADCTLTYKRTCVQSRKYLTRTKNIRLRVSVFCKDTTQHALIRSGPQ